MRTAFPLRSLSHQTAALLLAIISKIEYTMFKIHSMRKLALPLPPSFFFNQESAHDNDATHGCLGMAAGHDTVFAWSSQDHGLGQDVHLLRQWHSPDDTFTLAPGEWRICYRPHGSEPFSVTLRDADSGLNKRLTNQVGPNVASGVTRGSDGIKSAYLVVHGSDEGWQVWVEHYMDTVDEWNFRQSQPPRKALERLGSWTGEAAEQTVTVQVAAPHWRFSHEQLRWGGCAGSLRRHRPMPAASPRLSAA